ncbi:GNAT family N-acetyltransferase [Paractinoplanes durhamensis]|uniref:GNAT family acetyltransferase n=1 Tax=Paractinoplanes durhamensis TaxID=113563 RepID=A0ABQ3YQN2_9ACTN|nr:GNAT family N-acetyltransferase [Actinoplanes durhamensis]GID99879.1 GNAT family acetyltransferase [Actinoplanes durhamensis]
MLTARLWLRRPVPSDADAILRIHRDPLACEHNPGDMIGGRAEAVARCNAWIGHWERHGFGYHVLRRRESEHVIGFCGVKLVRLHDTTMLNLFYRLEPAAWGAGLAGEAVAAVVGAARGLPYPLIARVRPGNVASARVAARAGLLRAVDLDVAGEDGPDWVWALP